jgi:hypothetical protein
VGTAISYVFAAPESVSEARIVFDSSLSRKTRNMPSLHRLDANWQPPETLVKGFRIEGQDENGTWHTLYTETNNYQRLVRVPLDAQVTAIRLVPEATWGAVECRIFAFDVR